MSQCIFCLINLPRLVGQTRDETEIIKGSDLTVSVKLMLIKILSKNVGHKQLSVGMRIATEVTKRCSYNNWAGIAIPKILQYRGYCYSI